MHYTARNAISRFGDIGIGKARDGVLRGYLRGLRRIHCLFSLVARVKVVTTRVKGVYMHRIEYGGIHSDIQMCIPNRYTRQLQSGIRVQTLWGAQIPHEYPTLSVRYTYLRTILT